MLVAVGGCDCPSEVAGICPAPRLSLCFQGRGVPGLMVIFFSLATGESSMQQIKRLLAAIVRPGIPGLLALSLVLCGLQSGSAQPAGQDERQGITDKEIVIGSVCALSGWAAELGTRQLYGAKAYINEINANGGVHGRKIVLKEYDDKYNPEETMIAFGRLNDDKCFAAAFTVGTPTGMKAASICETRGIPLVGMFTGAQVLREPQRHCVFHVRASYYDETRAQIDRLIKDCGPKKVAVIYPRDAFGTAVLTGYEKALKTHGLEPVERGTYERNSDKVDDAIKRVRAAKPDFVGLVGPYASVAAIMKHAHDQGWYPTFGTVSFVGTRPLIRTAGKDAEGTIISHIVPAPFESQNLPTAELYKKLVQKYFPNADIKPGFTSFEGFVDAMVLVKGLEAAGKDLTRSKFIAALESLHNVDMGLGHEYKLTYGPTRHTGFDNVSLTVVSGSKAIALKNWPRDGQKP
jgi:branched-chain amino acid transport system substrate-binding protein